VSAIWYTLVVTTGRGAQDGAGVLQEAEGRLLLTWRAPAVQRVVVAVLAATIAVALAVPLGAPWQFTMLLGWNAAALAFLVLVWVTVSRFSAAQTAAMATLEDSSRRVSHSVLLLASTASLVSVAFGLHRANLADRELRFWMTVSVVAGIAFAWLVVHTVYVLRYAHLYYSGGVGIAQGSGILFPGGAEPDYLDFAYVAFTLGMTFQVSDNAFTTRPLRRAALAHCLLSYVFGAVVVAITINVIAGLV